MRTTDETDTRPPGIVAGHAPTPRCRPLELWRTEPLPDIGAEAAYQVRRALAGGVSLHHRSWPAARSGDAAAAIAVALHVTRAASLDPSVADLALSAVFVAATDGNSAARAVLDHVRASLGSRRRAAGRTGRTDARRLGRRPPPRR